MHTHGLTRPCNFRVGMNEGISILNNQANVMEMFTDGLIGCTQVILRNATATFCTHIAASAKLPVEFVLCANRDFISNHGAAQTVYVVTGAGAGAGAAIETKLNNTLGRAGIAINRVMNTGGYAINVATGAVRPTPPGWNVNSGVVSGYLTGAALTSFRYIDVGAAAEPLTGDYYELCGDCNA